MEVGGVSLQKVYENGNHYLIKSIVYKNS